MDVFLFAGWQGWIYSIFDSLCGLHFGLLSCHVNVFSLFKLRLEIQSRCRISYMDLLKLLQSILPIAKCLEYIRRLKQRKSSSKVKVNSRFGLEWSLIHGLVITLLHTLDTDQVHKGRVTMTWYASCLFFVMCALVFVFRSCWSYLSYVWNNWYGCKGVSIFFKYLIMVINFYILFRSSKN